MEICHFGGYLGANGFVLFDHLYIHRWNNRLSFIYGNWLDAKGESDIATSDVQFP